jgi:hypothetical protein
MILTREDAIRKFGRHYTMNALGLPSLKYPDFRELSGLKRHVGYEALLNGRFSSFQLEEKLGHDNSGFNAVPSEIQDLFKLKNPLNIGKLDPAQLTSIFKQAATEAYDNALTKIQANLNPPQEKSWVTKFMERLEDHSAPPVSGAELFSKLTFNVTSLPENIHVPDTTLNVGDKIYHVSDYDLRKNGLVITEYTVVSLLVRNSLTSKPVPYPTYLDNIAVADTFLIGYTAKIGEKGMPIHFELDDSGKFKGLTTGDCNTPNGYFFLTSKSAKDFVNKYWWDVEQQPNNYRRGTQTARPSGPK